MTNPINPTYPAQQLPPQALPPKKKGGCLKWGAGIFGAFIALGVLGSLLGGEDTTTTSTSAASSVASAIKAVDLPVSETPEAEAATTEATPITTAEAAPVQDVPREYKSALKKAEMYSDMMHMSKAGLYDQLTSEYGEKFSPEAAQYSVDNVKADWNANALAKARIYQDDMAMSPSGIYDQLVSEYGEQFTPEEAQYAVDNL